MSDIDVKPPADTQAGDFEPEQKRYLEGFVAGLQIAKAAKSIAGHQLPWQVGKSLQASTA